MNLAKKILGFDDKKMMLVGCICSAIFIPIFFFGNNPFTDFKYYLIYGILVTGAFTFLLWIVNTSLLLRIIDKYPFPQQTVKNITLQSVTLLVVTFILANGLAYIEHSLRNDDLYMEYVEREVGVSLILAGLITVLYNSIHIFKLLKESLVEKERLQKENVQSQLEILKNQVKPHFLFNSLNTLASIIPDEPEMAVDYVQKLSKVYRYILEIKDKKLISLEEELTCIKAYLFMLQIRFGDNLQVNIADDLPLNHHIVPLSLQLLIENAVKHNITSNKRPLHIDIFQEGNQLIIRNNLQLKEQAMPSTGTGLNNIRSRYHILTKQDIIIQKDETHFSVAIPLIRIM